MANRSDLKQASLERILGAAAARLRAEGLAGASVASVMDDAGLTHGAFYSHFSSKDDLAVAALQQAFLETRSRWIGKTRDPSWAERLQRLARRYLTRAHRDDLSHSCAFAAVGSEAARAGMPFRAQYKLELRKTLDAVCDYPDDDGRPGGELDDAIVLLALCIGGMTLARAVPDEEGLSIRILNACKAAAGRVTAGAVP